MAIREKSLFCLGELFSQLQSKRILVAGDFLLDRYTFGACKRISPEAPVPVVSVDREEERAGGAGNVALNLVSLGMTPIVFGRIGEDREGISLSKTLESEGISTKYLLPETGFQTPLKVRLIAGGQQLTRIDYEKPTALLQDTEKKLLSLIPELLSQVDLVAISDYAKGFLTPTILSTLIRSARKAGIPVISDPKGTELAKYSGSTIVKPNYSEACAAAPGFATLQDIARHLHQKVEMDVLLVTRSEAGISLFYPDGLQKDHPVEPQEVKDVTGAGDTVLAVLASLVANKIELGSAADLANIAAQVAIARLGCARVTFQDIARSLLDRYAHNKILDRAHFPALKEALRHEEFSHLEIEASQEFSFELIKTIRQLATTTQKDVVIHVSGAEIDEELLNGLAALKHVAYVLLT